MSNLKTFYEANISPSVASFYIVGDITTTAVIASLEAINDNWNVKDIALPEIETPDASESSSVYFYDVPGAKQSVIRFGYPALAVTDKDYYPATIMNYRLGGGGFASQLMQQLREGKGYTYGIGSRFSGSTFKGPFTISSNVRSNVTFESAKLVKDILSNYGENFNELDLDVTKSYLIKSNARAFETLGSKLTMIRNIGNYNFDDDYAKQREIIVKDMTVEEVKNLAKKYLDPNKMIYLFVGDAETQLNKLEQLGFGKPILLNN